MRRRIFALAAAIGLAVGLLALGIEAASASTTHHAVAATAIEYGGAAHSNGNPWPF